MLRPRLDNLWADGVLLHKDDVAIEEDLDVIARGIAPDMLLQTMLRAYAAASGPARARLDRIVPGWLLKRGHMDTLRELAVAQSLGPGSRLLGLDWLRATGTDTKSLESIPSLFLDAYYADDEVPPNGALQAFVIVLWYTSPKKRRAQGMAFLLDNSPPWDGSVKDILVTQRRAPKKLLTGILDDRRHTGAELHSITAERAKTVIITALNCNRAADLRLPRDLIAQRDMFVRQVMSLPDAPETPAFAEDDFDFLARHGQGPEEIVEVEVTVGRRVRLADGTEMIVMDSGDLPDEE